VSVASPTTVDIIAAALPKFSRLLIVNIGTAALTLAHAVGRLRLKAEANLVLAPNESCELVYVTDGAQQVWGQVS
jgi:glycerate-2-kinase